MRTWKWTPFVGQCGSSRWNAKIRPTHHARSGRLGADVGARRTPLRVRRLHVSSHMGSSHMGPYTHYPPLYALSAIRHRDRVFAIEIETCRRCGGRLRVIASIEAPATIERILAHLGRDAEPVDPAYPSRAPPQGEFSF